MPSEPPSFAAASSFATTRWSLVIAAGSAPSPAAREALSALCQTYWLPLYAYVRRRVPDVDEARDLTQAFFAELLEKNDLATADPTRGRFRAFLITAFKHYLSKQWAKARAQKRGGGQSPLSLDFASGDSRISMEPSSKLTAEQLYEREWAVTLLDEVLRRLEREWKGTDKADLFPKLKAFLIGQRGDHSYAEVAQTHGLSEAAVKMTVYRMRRRYRTLLREAIAETVRGPEEVDDEIRSLFEVFEG